MKKSQGKQALKTVSIIPTIFLIIAGIGLIYWGFNKYKEKQALDIMGKTAQGTVVDIYKNGIYNSPVVEFYTEDGTKMLFKSELETAKRKYKIGDKVEVIYNPADPTEAEINKFAERNFLHLFLMGVGALLIIVGIGIRFYFSNKAKEYE